MMTTSNLLRSAVILGLTAAPVATLAQTAAPADEAAPMTAAPAEETAAATFTDAQLDSFLTAAESVNELRKDYSEQLASAETDEDKQAIVNEANREMSAAVEEAEGIDVKTYNEISVAAQSDQALNERIMAMVKERSDGMQGG